MTSADIVDCIAGVDHLFGVWKKVFATVRQLRSFCTNWHGLIAWQCHMQRVHLVALCSRFLLRPSAKQFCTPTLKHFWCTACMSKAFEFVHLAMEPQQTLHHLASHQCPGQIILKLTELHCTILAVSVIAVCGN